MGLAPLLLALAAATGLSGCFGASHEEGETRPLRQFGRNGVLEATGIERFEDGEWLKHGPFTFRNARDEEISGGRYKSGLESGEWWQVYEDGSRGEGSFVKGQRSGMWRTYFPNGTDQDSGRYEEGRRTGEWTSRRQDGSLLRKAMYADGTENGPVTYFLTDGRTIDRERTGLYRDGELVAPSSDATR